MWNYIINPKTRRKVSIYTNLGKKILKHYISQLGGHNGPCGLNPNSGKCKKTKKWDHTNCKLVNNKNGQGICKEKTSTGQLMKKKKWVYGSNV